MLAVSAWCRYLRGVRDDGRQVVLDDPQRERLQARALPGGDDPGPLLCDRATFGSLGRCPAFVHAVQRDLRELEESDRRSVIAARTARQPQLAAA